MGAAVALQAAGLGLTFMSMQQQRKSYEMEAASYREQAEMNKIEALQQENERNAQLRRQLAALGTSMSAQGVALGTSASVSAIEEDERQLAKSDIASIRLMGQSQRRKYGLSAAGARAGSRAAFYSGATQIAGGIYDIKYGGS